MRRTLMLLGLLLLFSTIPATMPSLVPTAHAVVESKILQSYTTPEPPLDVVSSADGIWHFVLTEGGKIYIYAADGQLNDIVQVDPASDHIFPVGTTGNWLYVSSRANKTVQLLALDFAAEIDTAGAPFLGNPKAPVTLVIFSDFQCPHCAKIGPVIEEVLAAYPESVKVVYKHFPLRNHQFAPLAALASIAAQEQGKFWQFHDALFAAQKELSQNKIREIAGALQLDMPAFTAAIGSSSTKERLTNDMKDGRKAGVRGTPTVFINGRQPNKITFEELKRMIDTELAAALRNKTTSR